MRESIFGTTVKPDDPWRIKLDPVKHERIRCVVRKSYLYDEGARQCEIDWNGVRQLQEFVQRIAPRNENDVALEELYLHFEDALDERIPEQRRMTHADTIFSRMWQMFGPEASIAGYPKGNDSFIGLALDAGLR